LHDVLGAPMQSAIENLHITDFGFGEGAWLVGAIMLLLQRSGHALRSVRRSRRDHEQRRRQVGSPNQPSELQVARATNNVHRRLTIRRTKAVKIEFQRRMMLESSFRN